MPARSLPNRSRYVPHVLRIDEPGPTDRSRRCAGSQSSQILTTGHAGESEPAVGRPGSVLEAEFDRPRRSGSARPPGRATVGTILEDVEPRSDAPGPSRRRSWTTSPSLRRSPTMTGGARRSGSRVPEWTLSGPGSFGTWQVVAVLSGPVTGRQLRPDRAGAKPPSGPRVYRTLG